MADDGMVVIAVALLAACSIASIVFVIMYPYLSGDKQQEKRIASMTENRANKAATRSAAEIAANRKKQVTETLKDLEARQAAKEKATLRLRLQRAGLHIEPRTYWIASAGVGLALALIAYLSMPRTHYMPLGVLVAAFVGMFGLPRFVVAKLTARRQKKFLAELANAIDVVVRGVKSGLPLNECLGVIARESPEPLAGEFREVVEQQRIGVTLSEAMDRLVMRVPTPEVKFLTIVISIQQQAGGNLSEALGNLSGVLRDRLRMQLKVKALSAEAKASAMVLGSLPPGVMFMVSSTSPDYISPLFNTSTGHMFLAVSAFWMGSGIFIMKKMINFKF